MTGLAYLVSKLWGYSSLILELWSDTQPTEFRGKIPSYSGGGPQSQKHPLLSHFTVPGKDKNEIRLKA